MRHKVVEGKKAKAAAAGPRGRIPRVEPTLMQATATLFSKPRLWDAATRGSGLGGRVLGRAFGHFGPLPWPLSKWTNARDVPMLPKQSFRAWYAETHNDDGSPK
jgi:L-lactate dehydrogenase complex protein LldF